MVIFKKFINNNLLTKFVTMIFILALVIMLFSSTALCQENDTNNNNENDNTNNEDTNNNNENDNTNNEEDEKWTKLSLGVDTPNIGIGLGIKVDSYGTIMPNKKTTFLAVLGYELLEEKWYGLGENPTPEFDPATENNYMYFNDFYLKLKFNQILYGDSKDVTSMFLFGGLIYHMKFRVPFSYFITKKIFYMADLVRGDATSWTHKFDLFLDFEQKNDAFVLYKGFDVTGDVIFNFGSEMDFQYWSNFEFKIDGDVWLPFIGEKLFTHITMNFNYITKSLNSDVDNAFYSYPKIPNVVRQGVFFAVSPLHIMNNLTLGLNLELCSYLFNFKFIFPTTLKAILFVDMAIGTTNVMDLDVDGSVFRASYGLILEYRINILGAIAGLKVGVVMNQFDKFTPDLYLQMVFY